MKKILIALFILFTLQNVYSQQNKYRKSAKKENASENKKSNDYYDKTNNIYSNYKYNISFKVPEKWVVDKGMSEHTILRTYDADSSNSFTINVIESEYNVEEPFWKTYDRNSVEIEKKYKTMLETQLNTNIKNYTIEKSFIKNFQSLKRKLEFTRKDQDYEYEIVTIIQQVVKGNLTYTFSLNIPKMFYDKNPQHYNKLFLNLHFLADKKKLNSLINSK